MKLYDHIGEENYRAAAWLTDKPLLVPDVAEMIATVAKAVEARGLLLPDADALIERVVIALLGGHLILAGPPGTGKTTLAGIVAEAFGTTYDTETATADWSTFDVIGGLQPAMGDIGTEVLKPWLGHVPRAALRCADAIALHEKDAAANPAQAHWLIIDEFNRAEIDKAIGPLYTVLGGGGGPERRRLPLWFGDKPETQEAWIPDRFRIIGTLNSVDTAYVYTLSQGLQRRFQFVHVGVPAREQIEDETSAAFAQAATWWVDTYRPDLDAAEEASETARLAGDEAIGAARARLAAVLAFLRYDDAVAWPVGTAQVVDVARQIVVRAAAGSSGDLTPALDLALSDTLIPQTSQLLRTQLDAIEGHLGDAGDLTRSLAALGRVRRSQQTSFG
ncbi:MAG TPA: AAA family ATPase [Miltoncostaeaceae bacterium]|nr:AAA family ATPase [Miltoncostaeaceae bacterium]